MTSTILAVRAVTALYARNLLRIAIFILVGVYSVILALIIVLASKFSGWWLLLVPFPTLLFLIGVTLWTVARIITNKVIPDLNTEQTVAAKKVVSGVSKAVEHAGMSRFFLFFQVLKDLVLRPKSKQTFIGEIASTPGQLKRDFDHLRNLF